MNNLSSSYLSLMLSILETCYQPDAEITNGEWSPKTWINGEHIVKAKCTENIKCVGYWKRSEGVFGQLEAGGRTWAKDKPNTSVKGVWKKTASCQRKIILHLMLFIYSYIFYLYISDNDQL